MREITYGNITVTYTDDTISIDFPERAVPVSLVGGISITEFAHLLMMQQGTYFMQLEDNQRFIVNHLLSGWCFITFVDSNNRIVKCLFDRLTALQIARDCIRYTSSPAM